MKRKITIEITETSTIYRELEVTDDELKHIVENDSPILDNYFSEIVNAKDAERETNYIVYDTETGNIFE